MQIPQTHAKKKSNKFRNSVTSVGNRISNKIWNRPAIYCYLWCCIIDTTMVSQSIQVVPKSCRQQVRTTIVFRCNHKRCWKIRIRFRQVSYIIHVGTNTKSQRSIFPDLILYSISTKSGSNSLANRHEYHQSSNIVTQLPSC